MSSTHFTLEMTSLWEMLLRNCKLNSCLSVSMELSITSRQFWRKYNLCFPLLPLPNDYPEYAIMCVFACVRACDTYKVLKFIYVFRKKVVFRKS